MVKNSGMEILKRFNMYAWLTLTLGVVLLLVSLLMLQSYWMTLEFNTQAIIFGVILTAFIAISSRASMRKGR